MAKNEIKSLGLIVGKTIRKYRQKLNISQEELAERAGIHRTFMSHVECATRNITVYNLVKIARALKVRPSALLEDLK